MKTELGSILQGGTGNQRFFQLQRQCMATGTTNSVKFAMTISPPPQVPPPEDTKTATKAKTTASAEATGTTATTTRTPNDHTPGRTTTTRCGVSAILCGRHSLTRSKPERADVIEEKELYLETSTNRRDSCSSRTTQRSYADSSISSIVSQHKLELRKNGLVRTMAHNLDTSSPETAELIPPDGGSRKMRI